MSVLHGLKAWLWRCGCSKLDWLVTRAFGWIWLEQLATKSPLMSGHGPKRALALTRYQQLSCLLLLQ